MKQGELVWTIYHCQNYRENPVIPIFLQKNQLASKECVVSVADIKISRDIGLFLAQKYLSFTISS